jgi:DNA-binding NtrC family response regulator
MREQMLIIENEPRFGRELARAYGRKGWEVSTASSCAGASRLLIEEDLDPLVIIAEVTLPDGSALDVLAEWRDRHVGGEWVFVTDAGGAGESVRAMQLGAYDYLERPCDMERLSLVVSGAARSARAQRQLEDQNEAKARRYQPSAFVGRSEAAREIREILIRLADVPLRALILSGETGTGKGLVARILHYNGRRSAGPMVELNCAAVPKDLLESELFGHEAGAFTGAKTRHRGLLEQANGGSLFLDEIAEMDLDLQAKLLKAIEDHSLRRVGGEREIEVDVQYLVASSHNLKELARAGQFRSDLYHRLSIFELELPALRERTEDLDELVPILLEEFNVEAGKRVEVVTDEAWQQLRAYDWPGNVRELRNVIERGVLFSVDATLPVRWLQLGGRDREAEAVEVEGRRLVIDLDHPISLDSLERTVIEQVLARHGNNVSEAARALGVSRETLRYRVQKHGIERQAD